MTHPTVSVVVTAHGASPELFRCLHAIVSLGAPDELWIADGGAADPSPGILREYPRASVLHRPGFSVPALRWAAARASSGEVIASTEARMEPSPGWWRELAAAHERWPGAHVIGGTVDLVPTATALDRGLYLSEYVAFAPGSRVGEVATLSSGNLSYKRSSLVALGELLDQNLWDTVLHQRWSGVPGAIRLEAAPIVFLNGMTVSDALAMRFAYGRAYAAERLRHGSWPRRVLFGVGACALPLVLTARAARDARRYGSDALTPGGLAWALCFNTWWAAGEMCGYLVGDPR